MMWIEEVVPIGDLRKVAMEMTRRMAPFYPISDFEYAFQFNYLKIWRLYDDADPFICFNGFGEAILPTMEIEQRIIPTDHGKRFLPPMVITPTIFL